MEAAGQSELRLGLVLYGGVALAVYIYGSVVEVQRLIRGQSAAYAAAMEEAGLSRAVVDVISGTSAGGINGILLAKALATGADVTTVEDLWVEGGDIDVLLNRLGDASPASLLATEEFEKRLLDGFARLDKGCWQPDRDGVLDLFVSTTHLRGDRRGFLDALGREITTRVHRFVIQLKLRRRYAYDDFTTPPGGGDPNARLVKLARATSAFPVAFEPVRIQPQDHLLGPQAEPEGWFADGGILNNKPFTEALRTIYTRSAENGPVRRWLLSLDPDPKPIPAAKGAGPEPAFDEIAVSALTRIPRFQSIATDLEELERHNEAVRRVSRTVVELEAGIAEPGSGADVGAPASPSYRAMRRGAWAQLAAGQMLAVVRPADPAEFDPDGVLAALREGALGVIVAREAEVGGEGTDAERRQVTPDLAFQRRRVYYLIKLVGMAADPDGRLADVRAALWDAFEAISEALWKQLAETPPDLATAPAGEGGEEVEGAAAERNRANAVGAERMAAAWGSFGDTGSGLVDELAGSLERAGSVTLELDRPGSDDGPQAVVVSLGEVFANFGSRDFFLLSIATGGGIEFRDLVNHAQISPESAEATKVPAAKKLAGDTASHFGGFLDEGWRKNDILWGRLDASEILMRAILADAAPSARDAAIEAVNREILAEALPEALKAPDGDWRGYLLAHAIGDKTMGDLDPHHIRGLGYRAASVLRAMLHRATRRAEEGGDDSFRGGALRAADHVVHKTLRLPWWVAGVFLRRDAKKTEKHD